MGILAVFIFIIFVICLGIYFYYTYTDKGRLENTEGSLEETNVQLKQVEILKASKEAQDVLKTKLNNL